MSQTRYRFEIIVVVDGFADKTFDEAKRVEKRNIRVIGYRINKGKGYAIRYGASLCSGDIVIFIDAGMDINANGISMVLEHMEWYRADIIVGSKRHPVSKIHEYPLFRRIYSFGYHLIVKALFGVRVGDTQTGLKVYRREVVDRVFPRLVVKRFAFDIESLAVANHLGFRRIFEAPVEINWDFENTSFKKSAFLFLNPDIRGVFIDTLAIFYRLHFLKYYEDSNKRNWMKVHKLSGVKSGMRK
ncbi:hypothetical protein A2716_03690 [candidate division WWE3 bacterium RIFCSPHIGHO2_01_FULL_40_23]|uniref:Glycosyltransferase 2-like domain-containing protein n=1 Tax=candidate division WWE3 bacterium RIFCSPLOWO2_01_FULL_41_18 TaxID=1802625 RepID=A0A1F4VCJ7_UNCKA|nr:MAG: hypothetical protein A2716_03690 [candidate division WWE3 bacterium RIFCSPHIGHO2_01_FULL_40_23]OGC54981.1 MAG: hypothetical protein A3A78_03300 [candidate division WWE3 bacterium RIFCSPLOWO2_01_FULL_41_18]